AGIHRADMVPIRLILVGPYRLSPGPGVGPQSHDSNTPRTRPTVNWLTRDGLSTSTLCRLAVRERLGNPTRFAAQALTTQPGTPPAPDLDQPVPLQLSQDDRDRLSRYADQASQFLVRKGQTDLVAVAPADAVRLDQLLEKADEPFST